MSSPNNVTHKMNKRKLSVAEQSEPCSSIKRPTTLTIEEPSAPLHCRSVIPSSTRPITTIDPATIKGSKLTINLAEMESSGSDEDLMMSRIEKQQQANEKQRQATGTTPLAVRLLPVSSQDEYRRLVQRMEVLEKQKSLKQQKSLKRKPSPLVSKESSVEKPSTSKASRKKLEANESLKERRLKALEKSFAKIGTSMISNLDKSLQMVEEAKKSKVIRMRCSQRLEEINAEIQSVEQSARQEERKLALIQPEIQASHELIISQLQKRQKFEAAALNLGQELRGNDYRLRDEGKAEISSKSKQLNQEIRLYNTGKFDDLNKLTEAEKVAEKEPEKVAEKEAPKEAEKEAPKAVDAPELAVVKDPPKYKKPHMRELKPGPPESHYFPAYQSPITPNFYNHHAFNAIVCPFDLMGICEDWECKYLHLDRPEVPKTTTTNKKQ